MATPVPKTGWSLAATGPTAAAAEMHADDSMSHPLVTFACAAVLPKVKIIPLFGISVFVLVLSMNLIAL